MFGFFTGYPNQSVVTETKEEAAAKREEIKSIELQLLELKVELQRAKESRKIEKKDHRREIRHEEKILREKERTLFKLGRKARGRMGFYQYAKFMRAATYSQQATRRNSPLIIEQLLPNSVMGKFHQANRAKTVRSLVGPPSSTTTTTVDGSSSSSSSSQALAKSGGQELSKPGGNILTNNVIILGIRMLAAAVLEVKLLRAMHVLMTLKVQQDIHREEWNSVLLELYKYVDTAPTKEMEAKLTSQIINVKHMTAKIRGYSEDTLELQRKLIRNFKMKEVQDLSNRSLARIKTMWVKEKPSSMLEEVNDSPEKKEEFAKKTDEELLNRLAKAEERFTAWRQNSERRLQMTKDPSTKRLADQRKEVWEESQRVRSCASLSNIGGNDNHGDARRPITPVILSRSNQVWQ